MSTEVSDYLAFRRMITPVLIKILFFVGAGLSVILGLIMFISGLNSSFGGGMMVFGGIIEILLGPIVVRIMCELLILFFRMNGSLTDIRAAALVKAPEHP